MNLNSKVAALILARNEEYDIEGCLRTLEWVSQVYVVDAFSSDRTVAIAKAAGAVVVQRTFDDYASQRNFGLHHVAGEVEWLLVVDADERIPELLGREILSFVQFAPSDVSAGRLRRRDHFMGRWIRHAAISPYFVRLVRPKKVHYTRTVNEVIHVDGRTVDLQEPFDHYPFSKGISHWIAKHNIYSSMEAELIVNSVQGGPIVLKKALLSVDFNERRLHQKRLFYRLPGRPLIKWFYMMFIRGAFLDGRPGVVYAALQTWYEYLIVLKTRELRRTSQFLEDPPIQR